MDEDQSDPNSGVEGQEPHYEDDFEEAPEGTESELSENLSYSEKQDGEVRETGHGRNDPVRSDDPLLSDEDDSDHRAKTEADAILAKANVKDELSDTDISEIPMQDPASDREILDEEMEYSKEIDKKQESVSDEQDVNISADNYMDLPGTGRTKSGETEEIAHAVYDTTSVVSDVFEPSHRTQPPSIDYRPKYSRYDNLRSKYTIPRPPPHKPDDVSLSYLPARGVRSYAPFLKSSPLAEFYRGDQVRWNEILAPKYITKKIKIFTQLLKECLSSCNLLEKDSKYKTALGPYVTKYSF